MTVKKIELTSASTNARVHRLAAAEASRPPARANNTAQNSSVKAVKTSTQFTPPSSIGIVKIGSTESQSVMERKACTRLLPTTMDLAVNGVRNNSPNVPSLFSRLKQSAVNAGTITQMVTKIVV